MDNKTKAIIGLVLVAILGLFGTYTGWTRPLPKPEAVTVEKVVTQGRIVVKKVDQVKTETRPDGTKIVTETRSDTHSDTKRAETARQVTVTRSVLPRYSLGVGVTLDPFNPLQRDYSIETGVRLWKSPLWGKVEVSTKKTVTLGLEIEF